jgi:hypothetical protein
MLAVALARRCLLGVTGSRSVQGWGALGLCRAWRGRAVGGGTCEAALIGHCGVAWPGDVVAKSMVTRWVGEARCMMWPPPQHHALWQHRGHNWAAPRRGNGKGATGARGHKKPGNRSILVDQMKEKKKRKSNLSLSAIIFKISHRGEGERQRGEEGRGEGGEGRGRVDTRVTWQVRTCVAPANFHTCHTFEPGEAEGARGESFPQMSHPST